MAVGLWLRKRNQNKNVLICCVVTSIYDTIILGEDLLAYLVNISAQNGESYPTINHGGFINAKPKMCNMRSYHWGNIIAYKHACFQTIPQHPQIDVLDWRGALA